MYRVGDLIVYGGEGVCRVEAVGPLDKRGVRKDVEYYTLAPVHRDGKIFAPVDVPVFTRPVMTREEAEELIDRIPEIPEAIYENSNSRLLDEHYRAYLKSYDCENLLRLIRSVHAKEINAAGRGRRLGQVDERNRKRAEERLYDELAVALGIEPDQVKDYIVRRLEKQK